MKKVLASILLASVATAVTAAPRERGLMDPMIATDAQPTGSVLGHNGSIMTSLSSKQMGLIWIVYVQPRPEVAAAGVVPGTPLVVGGWNGARFDGEAYVFSTFCRGPIPYRVTGIAKGGDLFLEGQSPVIDEFCNVLGLTWQSPNAHLVFRSIKL